MLRKFDSGSIAWFLMSVAALGIGCSPPDSGRGREGKLPLPSADFPAPAADEQTREVVLAGGCFWCTEAVFEEVHGVLSVESGYAGGTEEDAIYELVAQGQTQHAEAIRIVYDPRVITYGELLRVFFDVAHDPTQVNRQGPDVGRQYRSAVFYASDDQKRVAQAYIEQLEKAGVFGDPVATTLEPLEEFYPAEGYHQDYVVKNPRDLYVLRYSTPKVEKLRARYAELLPPSKE